MNRADLIRPGILDWVNTKARIYATQGPPMPTSPENSSDWVHTAREIYADDNINVDEDAAISLADDGAWVAAWVWVDTPGGNEP